jgi:hypothetical protein
VFLFETDESSLESNTGVVAIGLQTAGLHSERRPNASAFVIDIDLCPYHFIVIEKNNIHR